MKVHNYTIFQEGSRALWNNNCTYDGNGQVMVAEVVERGVMFSDLSRGIHGLIRDLTSLDRRVIMIAYDNNLFTHITIEEGHAFNAMEQWGKDNLEKVAMTDMEVDRCEACGRLL